MRTTHLFALIGSAVAITSTFFACSGKNDRSGFDDPNAADGSVDGDPNLFAHPPDAHHCKGLECQQQTCPSGSDTTVTGTVFAPNGKLPLYNGIVYVPNSDPDDLPVGASCDVCGAVTGEPVVTALSDATGKFTLSNVPVGKDIPIVVQIGKWRRQTKLPEVKACQENKITDPELTRLPKNQAEGNMPKIALTTGGCDNLGCMLPKVGIDPAEIGGPGDANKAVHVYNGSGGQAPSFSGNASSLWSDANLMKKYDMLVLSCECYEALDTKGGSAKSPDFAEMTDYLKAGGRIFTTDFMYTWYKYSPDGDLNTIGNIPGGAPGGGSPVQIDQTFAKGKALADWLQTVGVSPTNVTADAIFSNIHTLDSARTQTWATSPDGFGGTGAIQPRVFTVNLPIGLPVDQQCGRGVHIDMHVNTTDHVDQSYPAGGCNTALRPAENLLSFFFFDLASCLSDDKQPPKPPNVQ
jgi:hypothetical protein